MASQGTEPSTSYPSQEQTQGRKPRQLSEKQQLKRWFDSLTYEEQCLWQQKAAYELLKDQYTEFQGETWSLWDLGIAREFEVQREERGIAQDTFQDAREAIDRKPGYMLRQGAPKMNLRPAEEAALGLQLMGRGNKTNFTFLQDLPLIGDFFPPSRDFTFGIFCKSKLVQRLLAKRYGRRDAHEVLSMAEFYQDLILNAPRIELTSMMVITRQLPVDAIAKDYMPRITEPVREGISLQRTTPAGVKSGVVPCSSFDKNEVNRFASMFTPAALKGLPIATPDGASLLEGTKVFMSAKPGGGLLVEAESPGALRDQQHLVLGEFRSRPLTYLVFDSFLGARAIDPVAKLDVGACFLYFANGFTLSEASDNPHQFRASDPLRGQGIELVEPRRELFKLPRAGDADGGPSNLLVGGIARRRRAREQLRTQRESGQSGPTPALQ